MDPNRTKVSSFVHDLSDNPIGRMYPLLRALEGRGYDIEAIGFLISRQEIYRPYRDKLPYKTLSSPSDAFSVLRHSVRLSRLATGDIIYAGKPLLTSFFPALLASGFGYRKPLILDVEDDDVWAPVGSDSLPGFIQFYLRGFKQATACKWGVMLHPFTRLATSVTVSSTKLQHRYGGTIVRHGPDESVFDPKRRDLDQAVVRSRFGIPRESLVVCFAGTPHPHKGLDRLLEALHLCRHPYFLLLCGDPGHPLFASARSQFPGRCICTGFLPNDDMPAFLSAGDVVPILQKPSRYAEAQLPAKLLEALAMEKMIVATPVGDIENILGVGGNELRGWIAPDSPNALASVFDEIAETLPEARAIRTTNARRWYLANASTAANGALLDELFTRSLQRSSFSRNRKPRRTEITSQ